MAQTILFPLLIFTFNHYNYYIAEYLSLRFIFAYYFDHLVSKFQTGTWGCSRLDVSSRPKHTSQDECENHVTIKVLIASDLKYLLWSWGFFASFIECSYGVLCCIKSASGLYISSKQLKSLSFVHFF